MGAGLGKRLGELQVGCSKMAHGRGAWARRAL